MEMEMETAGGDGNGDRTVRGETAEPGRLIVFTVTVYRCSAKTGRRSAGNDLQ